MEELSCNYFNNKSCASCSLLNYPLAQRKKEKDKIIFELFNKELTIQNSSLLPIVEATSFFPSRTKAKLSVTGSVIKPIIGLVDKNFNGIELQNCPLHFSIINKVLNFLPKIIFDYKLTPYNIIERTGELKGFIVNANSSESEVSLRFVLRSKDLVEKISEAVAVITKEIPQVKVISANIQPIPNQVLEGKEELLLTREESIWQEYSDLSFAFSAQSFSQVTPEIATKLYLYVQGLLEKTKPQQVIDLYCGVGGFSIFASKYAKKVLGIEYSANSIRCAKKSAIKNNIDNVEFLQADSNDFLRFVKDKPVDIVICNPPRRGLDVKVIEDVLSLAPGQIIYSSRNPETLARDLKLLYQDYKLLSLAPFDMFPLTRHLEIVAHLQRQ